MRGIHQTCHVDASRLGDIRLERTAQGADVLRRRVALGPDEWQAVLELTQLAPGCELQQSVDRRPILLEGIHPQQTGHREAHVGLALHEVLIDRRSLFEAPHGHSCKRDHICRPRIQRVQSIRALCLFGAFANPPHRPEEIPDVLLAIARTGHSL